MFGAKLRALGPHYFDERGNVRRGNVVKYDEVRDGDGYSLIITIMDRSNYTRAL